jgi:hypothetical protein
MAYQMGHIPPLDSLSLAVAEGGLLSLLLPAQVPLVAILRLAFVLFAAVLSAIILWNALGRAQHSGQQVLWLGWSSLIAICTAYTALGLYLAVG